ncbi:hypothetical protein DYL59_01670 [Pseudomonas kairouanensis]|uniref:Uncharacterized protein n=1 Tax=Pseudomonas kairouanensis TaxID=2293832 RepID=A0A4Z0B0V3_9PSED|nr:hypothetical protein DYL59_01670 [Pseudomonas kairouanensis]
MWPRCFSDSSVVPGRALSRASPLPHLTEYILWNAVRCGSGLAREEARPANPKTHPVTPCLIFGYARPSS